MDINSGFWHVAYRHTKCGSILDDRITEFKVIPNSWRYCAMDPFVIKKDGKIYIFSELYDIVRQRGIIGYTEFSDGKFSKYKPAIVEPYHMSFPFLFEEDNEVYMIPETYQDNRVSLYRAVSFPDKWEKCEELLGGGKYVDTVVFDKEENRYLFTYNIDNNNKKELVLYKMSGMQIKRETLKIISCDDERARPAGNIINLGTSIVRVSQECKDSYGKGLVFSKITSTEPYEESEISRLYIDDIKLDRNVMSLGIHTYNSLPDMEIIDIKGTRVSVAEVFFRIIYKLRKRLK